MKGKQGGRKVGRGNKKRAKSGGGEERYEKSIYTVEDATMMGTSQVQLCDMTLVLKVVYD